ncbi:MAG TPA: hypothetical protein VEU33_27605, partial [Archangium sp.]|nr:hypothetical protein [Archangium sp.]
ENGTERFKFFEGEKRRLKLFLVKDAYENQVGENGCVLSDTTASGMPDRLTITSFCEASAPDTVTCSSGAIRALLEQDASGSAVLFVLAHELGHLLLPGHTGAAYDRYTVVPRNQSRQQKLDLLLDKVCVIHSEAVDKEHQADFFAMRVVALGGDLLAALEHASMHMEQTAGSAQVGNQCRAEHQGWEVITKVASALTVWQRRFGLLGDLPPSRTTDMVQDALCRCEGLISWPLVTSDHPPPGVRVARLLDMLRVLHKDESALALMEGQRPILSCNREPNLAKLLPSSDIMLPASERKSGQFDIFINNLCEDLNLARRGGLFPECTCPTTRGR